MPAGLDKNQLDGTPYQALKMKQKKASKFT